MAGSEAKLKLAIDRVQQKVIFAEANKDSIDRLCSLLNLPIGGATKFLGKENFVGCVAKLFDSVVKLGDKYMQSKMKKDVLVKPDITCLESFLETDGVSRANEMKLYYMCSGSSSPRQASACGSGTRTSLHLYVADDPQTICPQCQSPMSTAVQFVSSKGVSKEEASVDESGYVKGIVTYIVSDDLVVEPSSSTSTVDLLKKNNVRDSARLDMVDVSFGAREVLKLLEESLKSESVLTNVFLEKQKLQSQVLQYQYGGDA